MKEKLGTWWTMRVLIPAGALLLARQALQEMREGQS